MTKFKKTALIGGGIIAIFFVVVILLISPITKYVIEKYDQKYTGRRITMGWAYVNPFTGYIHFSDFKIHESKSDSIFFSADGISVNISMAKLFTKTYEVSDFTLDHPRGTIIQNKNDFNYNDLIARFSSKDNRDTVSAPVHFNILNIKIIDGEFRYIEESIPINYAINKLNFESSGKSWDTDTIAGQFTFKPETGSGDVKGDFTFNMKSMEYRTSTIIQKFDLNIIGQYMKDLSNYGNFSANLDADMTASGNFNDEENINIEGKIAINDFHFGKSKDDDYAAFKKFSVGIIELSPKNHKYNFDTLMLSQPYFKYERYDSLDNLQSMFGKGGSNISANKADETKFNLILEIADYVKVLSKNFFSSDYKINNLTIINGDVRFHDYSISEKFELGMNPLSVHADSIDKNHDRIALFFNSGMKPYGNVDIALSINPKDSSDFDLKYDVAKIPVPMFNPYIISYTSYPMDRGTIELNGTWDVRNGIIKSENHLLVIDPRVTKRLKNKNTSWIPMRLALAFIRERGNVIDYEIPITGNLKDPKFHLRDIVFDVLTNIFVKPATTTYRMQVKDVETEIEKSLSLKWEMRHNSLRSSQEKFIEKIADFLKKTPDASITVYPEEYAVKEKEYILFFEAKKKYYMSGKDQGQLFTEEDSEKVDKMSVKDPLFIKYLNKHAKDTMLFTIQGKCNALVNSSIINAKFENLKKEREHAFLTYFKNSEVDNRVKMQSAENVIPKNGFSFFRIEYKGEFPESLLKAYRQMTQLNNETPRKKFKQERRKNGSDL